MILGSLLPHEKFTRLSTEHVDELTKIAMDAMTENPVIDEQIRQNPVIMKELSEVVARALNKDDKGKG